MNNYALIENGQVVNIILWEGVADQWTPPDGTHVVAIDEHAHVAIGDAFDGRDFIAVDRSPADAPISPEQRRQNNAATRDMLLLAAAFAIAPLQDAVDLGDATDSELALLTRWKQYRVNVNRTDIGIDPPPWPDVPSATSPSVP